MAPPARASARLSLARHRACRIDYSSGEVSVFVVLVWRLSLDL